MSPKELHDKSERDLLIMAVTKIEAIETDLKRGAERMNDHDKRLRTVEARRCPEIPPNESARYIKFFGILLTVLMISIAILNFTGKP